MPPRWAGASAEGDGASATVSQGGGPGVEFVRGADDLLGEEAGQPG